MTKERPILFSAPMVRALLNDTKTQTRRLIKPQPYVDHRGNFCWNGSNYGQDGQGNPLCKTLASPIPSSRTKRVLCPYGKPGDRLWVRESFFQRGRWGLPEHPEAEAEDRYWIGSKEIAYAANVKRPGHDWRTRPSIHMPRWASRITLEITEVRVERLQDISEEDARAEGITDGGCLNCGNSETDCGCLNPKPDARDYFIRLWQSINGPESWDANPWVWAVSFKRLAGST
jgi:hypothetical protein